MHCFSVSLERINTGKNKYFKNTTQECLLIDIAGMHGSVSASQNAPPEKIFLIM